MLVVIIGLLALMSMPAFQNARSNTQNTRIINDLRIFKQGFSNYSLDNGQWPPEADAGELPAPMEGFLIETVFESRTVVGGRYDYDFQKGPYQACIVMRGSFLDQAQALQIDKRMDDGSLSTGNFRAMAGDYVMVLED